MPEPNGYESDITAERDEYEGTYFGSISGINMRSIDAGIA